MATSLDRGLPGVIQSPNFDYNQMPWETGRFEGAEERGKVPQMCKLSFKFKVIHDIDPYIDEDYNMDTGNLRRFGNLNEVSQRTEEQESDTQRTESIGAISQDNEDQ